MALDLCNKSDLVRTGSAGAVWEDEIGAGAGGVPLGELVDEQRDELSLALQSTLGYVDPRYAAGDPAAWGSDFGYALDRAAVRIDARPREELREQALDDPDPAMREQALYEYADRNEPDTMELLAESIRYDSDPQVRWDVLWAVQKLGGASAVRLLERFRQDRDLEIAEWARLLSSEIQTGDPTFDARPLRYTEGRTFDETIFLLIHCDLYVRLDGSNRHWGKLSLAPQGLAKVYGQAHACPNFETRERRLVIAKTISGLHPDGSPHIDNYLFRGFTDRSRPDRGSFFFESLVERPFYHSGHADDASQGMHLSRIGFLRYGAWFLDPSLEVRGHRPIRYVRGRFQGWGYVNLERVAGRPIDEMLTPGNAILSTLHDPVAEGLTNTFILGTFKGKLNDWDGDGSVDLNSRPVYSTVDGEIDSDMDGRPDRPGATCCDWVNPLP